MARRGGPVYVEPMSAKKKNDKRRKSKQDVDPNGPPENAPPIPGVAPPEEPQVGDDLPPHDQHSRRYDPDSSKSRTNN